MWERELFADSPASRVIELTVTWWAARTRMTLWAVVNSDGICEAAVNKRAFAAADLEELRRRLRVGCYVVEAPVKASGARTSYPNVLPWWLAHSVGLFWGLFILACLVVAVGQST